MGLRGWLVWRRRASVGADNGLGNSSCGGMARNSAARAGVGAAVASGCLALLLAHMSWWWPRQLLETVEQRRTRGSSGARGTVVARPAILIPSCSYCHRVWGGCGRRGRHGRARGMARTATRVGRGGALARPRDGEGRSWRSSCCRRRGWPTHPWGGEGRSRRRPRCRRQGRVGWALAASGASGANGCRGRRRGPSDSGRRRGWSGLGEPRMAGGKRYVCGR